MNIKLKLQMIIISLAFLGMFFIWHIDVSTVANKKENLLTNGWMNFEPVQIYHLSLYGLIIVFILLIVLFFYLVQKLKDPNV